MDRLVALRGKGWGFGVALAAALMLVLQTAVAALAIGQGQPPLDIFGNPLCITTASDHTAPAKNDHPSLPECCTLGCNMFSTAIAPPPDGLDVAALARVGLAIPFFPAWHDPAIGSKHAPGIPRAPPLAA